MELFLTGGGDLKYYRSLDSLFQKEFKERKKSNILIIPHASDPEDYEEVYDRLLETFDRVKENQIILLEDLFEIDHPDYFKENDIGAIYLDGGNTFQLISELMNSAFPQLIRDFVKNKEGLLYGDSAGAIVMGDYIHTAYIGDEGDDNLEGLQSYHGLNLLEPWSFHCHYQGEENNFLKDFVYDHGSPILALSEETGIYLKNDEVKVFGQTPLMVFPFGEPLSFRPGETFSLKDFVE